MKKADRNIGLDLLRIFACFLVILYHVPQFVQGTIEFHDIISRALNSSFYYVGRCAVPLFFIMSGYLLLPLKSDADVFFKKRFTRIVVPTAFWFLLYILFGKVFDNPVHSFWIDKTPHMWYLYALMGLYLAAPIVSAWYKEAKTKVKVLYLILWVITLLFVLRDHAPLTYQFTHQGMLYTSPLMSLLYFSGYIGYFFLGAMIRDYYDALKKHLAIIIAGGLVLYILVQFIGIKVFETTNANIIAYCSIPTAILSSIFFLGFYVLGNKLTISNIGGGTIKRIVTDLSNATFSMYLMHVLILENVQIETIGGYSRLLIAIIVFVISYLIYKLLSLIPYSKYILG